jgi:hypothetical protein
MVSERRVDRLVQKDSVYVACIEEHTHTSFAACANKDGYTHYMAFAKSHTFTSIYMNAYMKVLHIHTCHTYIHIHIHIHMHKHTQRSCE